jgi:hypothetical protein
MGAVASNNTPATDLAFDRVAELIVADEIDVPNRSVFIPADIPDFGSVMRRALLEERPIVVIYPDGCERVIEPADAADLK